MTFASRRPAKTGRNYLKQIAKHLMVWQLLVLIGVLILQTK
jgi:hypothetical protein